MAVTSDGVPRTSSRCLASALDAAWAQDPSSVVVKTEAIGKQAIMNEPATTRIALVMSGGNALGAFHAGAYEAMHDQGLRPSWIAGSSIGAVTGALIAGNPQERRIEMLKQFWNEASVL
jgi:Patatin-like phospholipase